MSITFITWYFSILLDKTNHRKIITLIGVFLALIPLLPFKYYDFLNETIWRVMQECGVYYKLNGLNWAIPIGISFYTFQALGYFLDVYHKRIKVEHNLIDYVLFVSFFPQITSGPISKADELLPQIKSIKTFNYNQACEGLRYLLWGVFMKVVLADRAGIYVDMVFNNYESFSGLNCLLSAFMYSIQIYGDFAGYSLMAVGVGKLLGFNLIDNFNRPYLAQSITNFWKRWHISLTRWLTQQIYIPLGGNRCSKSRQYYNILITFLVSGIWHGANWTFVIWGIMHGLFQIIEKALGIGKRNTSGIWKIFNIGITFSLVTFAWIIFRSPSLYDAVGYISQLMISGPFTFEGIETLAFFCIALIILLLWEILQEYYVNFTNKISKYKPVRWSAYLLLIVIIMLNGIFDGGQFIYANF